MTMQNEDPIDDLDLVDPDNTDPDVDEDPTGAHSEDDPDAGDEGDDSQKGDDSDEKDLPKGVVKRIGKLTARAKEAEKERDELRAKFGDGDPEIFAEAARVAGVATELLSKDEAAGLVKLHETDHRVSALEGLLDRVEDSDDGEIEVNGNTYTKAQIKASLRAAQNNLRELERRFGGAERELQKKSKEIFKLGLAAQKAGFKPGMKVSAADDEQKAKAAKRKADSPASRSARPANTASGEIDLTGVDSEDALARALAGGTQRKR